MSVWIASLKAEFPWVWGFVKYLTVLKCKLFFLDIQTSVKQPLKKGKAQEEEAKSATLVWLWLGANPFLVWPKWESDIPVPS